MDNGERKSGWRIWVYLTPVYIIVAIPLVLWMKKVQSSDVGLSSDEYSAFNDDRSRLRKKKVGDNPGLTDLGYVVRYRPEGIEDAARPVDSMRSEDEKAERREKGKPPPPKPGKAGGAQYRPVTGGQAALESDETRQKEQMSVGYKQGYLLAAVEKVMGSPKAVKALMNNSFIVDGFMARPNLKKATASPQALAEYLKGPGPSNFLNNSVVKAAMKNPEVVKAVASSGMASALIKSPAAQGLLKDPQAMTNLLESNPKILDLAMQHPEVLAALKDNPDAARLIKILESNKIGAR